MPPTDDSRDFDSIHPDLEAAMARDGVPMMHLARLVDMDPRAVRRWGDAQKLLADFVAGRARAVRVMGGALGEEPRASWMLEVLADRGVPPVDVASVADALERVSADMDGITSSLRWLSRITATKPHLDATGALTAEIPGYTVPAMNADLLHDVASKVRLRAKGQMVMFAQKVPPDFSPRLAAAARKVNMTPSDFLRALVELHTEPAPS